MAKTASRVLRTGGLYFGGVGGYVRVPMSQSLRLTTEFTIMFWIYFPQPIGGKYDRGWHIVAAKWDYYLRYNQFSDPNIFEVLIFDTTNTERVLGLFFWNPSPGWYHIAVSWKSGVGGGIYRNNIKITSLSRASYTIRQTTSLLDIGWLYYPAVIDEVRIYNRALSADEIYEIYSKGTFIKDGLVLYLPFYEGEGNIAHDVSGYGNHGTIYGGASWVVKKALRVLPKAR